MTHPVRTALWMAFAVVLTACASPRALGNPILSSGRDYSADPAPIVVGDTLYILAGRDVAAPDQNDFVMPEWQLLSVAGDPMRSRWQHTPHFMQPEHVFAWAANGRAYAAQIVRGPDARYYLYAPVSQRSTPARDSFAIGVAVADAPTGPWRDAHQAGPIVSQAYPVPNTILNIDPTVLVDDDGRVFLYWGSFGKLKAVELERDMVTFKGRVLDVQGASGFFEAPWLFKRRDTYLLAYAAKVRPTPLPPDMWGTWTPNNPARLWVQYQWDTPQTITTSSLWFWGDHAAGSGDGVAAPRAWHLEYWNEQGWQPVSARTAYGTLVDTDNRVEFTPVTTRCLRAVFDASTDGKTFAAVAAQEWRVDAVTPRAPRRPSVKGAASADCAP